MLGVYRVNILEDRLEALTMNTPGIRGAVIVSAEGFVVAAFARPGTDQSSNTPQVAAMAATLFALGEQTLLRLEQGGLERLLIDGAEGAMIIYPINEYASLTAMLEKSAKVGVSMLAIKRAARSLQAVLSGAEA